MNDSQLIEVLDYWNFWNQDRRTGVYRKDYVDELYRQGKLKEASIVAGVRRAGKSTILLQVLRKLIDSGTPRENILYVNFEEPTFIPYLTVEFLLRIHDLYLERFNPRGRSYVVLDEVQLVPGWERFVAVLATDADNVFLVLTARQLNPDIHIVARACHVESKSKLRAAGANNVESPYEMGGVSMARRIIRPTVTNFLDLAFTYSRKDIQMEEIPVSPSSALSNVMLKDSGIRQQFNLIIIAIKKSDDSMLFNPSFETLIKAGDTVIAVGEEANLKKLEDILNP